MTFITAYNFIFTPKNEINAVENKKETPHQNFGTIFISFFKKKQIGLILAFILVFRLGVSQLLKMLSPFLLDGKELGGMGLDTEAVGIIYGTLGIFALTVGGILGGIALSKHGLTKWMLPMFLAMHLPIIGFILLAFFHPTSIYYIYAVVILEQFGYGFGFTAFMMFLINVADT